MATAFRGDDILRGLQRIPERRVYGRVVAILGMLVEIAGLDNSLSIGARCELVDRFNRRVRCEIIGFRDNRALALAYGALEGIGLGSRAIVIDSDPVVYPTRAWLGRVVNAMGEPIDGKGPLPSGALGMRIRAVPPPAHARTRVGRKIDLGVRSINTFATCCLGQRMGIFSASGVGKSVLLSMMARYAELDVNVVGLVGERGREVQEFIVDELGTEGLAKSVIVVATSDESPLMRKQAAQMTMAMAEYFRDQGDHVLCLMDSVTRFAMAMREIGLSVGEPPASKGYTPSTFAELPRLLERAGPGIAGSGSITGLVTVLVEGDDHNEPIADAVRGILDGHIVLERPIAGRGRYPAVNVLRSLSRTMPNCNSAAEAEIIRQARRHLSIFEDMAELIRLGAYCKGADPQVDEAIRLYPLIESFLNQERTEHTNLDASYGRLADILGLPHPDSDTTSEPMVEDP